jgi:hypothetical protein
MPVKFKDILLKLAKEEKRNQKHEIKILTFQSPGPERRLTGLLASITQHMFYSYNRKMLCRLANLIPNHV